MTNYTRTGLTAIRTADCQTLLERDRQLLGEQLVDEKQETGKDRQLVRLLRIEEDQVHNLHIKSLANKCFQIRVHYMRVLYSYYALYIRVLW